MHLHQGRVVKSDVISMPKGFNHSDTGEKTTSSTCNIHPNCFWVVNLKTGDILWWAMWGITQHTPEGNASLLPYLAAWVILYSMSTGAVDSDISVKGMPNKSQQSNKTNDVPEWSEASCGCYEKQLNTAGACVALINIYIIGQAASSVVTIHKSSQKSRGRSALKLSQSQSQLVIVPRSYIFISERRT